MIEPSPEAELTRAFANTVDLEDETDELAASDSAAAWLRARGLVDEPVPLSADDHRRLLDLRAGVRSALGQVQPGGLAAGEAVLSGLPVLVSLSAGGLVPAPGLPVADRALARLAIAWSALVTTGEAQRLKRCADDVCGWVFWDVSRNHSRRWCKMRVCGNRAKSRRYSARQRALRLREETA
ncbi:CGNR zinc finger domain-containing protein [Saccharothrix lopnurensis]|uniref:CGNR zinc finger domain-containing protein n=1 Tax=Saccharothrix lopnurensis TaxID=1670621 RepID=A0ABW1PG44_9PSEU